MTLALANPELLARLRPFVVATEDHQARFDLAPFGLPIRPDARFDPLREASASFLEMLRKLDTATFGPEGMPMPRWVFFDGAELPGGIAGYGEDAATVPAETRALLGVPSDYRGIVPYSMFIAIPTHESGIWMAHNLASISRLIPGVDYSGLGALTKATGLVVYRARRQIGATQWNSHALMVHTRLGALELLSAWTPAHSEPWTLTYGVDLPDSALRHLARDLDALVSYPAPDFFIDSDDHASMQALQARIEAGERYVIAGRPRLLGPERLEVPVTRR
jgi:hypothetical protein